MNIYGARVSTGRVFAASAAAIAIVAGACAPTSATVAATTTPAAVPTMTMEQTLSDRAQLTTIAFDGLAFLTGSLGSDSFFPPGKVADFWGFQYLRDNDPSGMGHNTDFLTRASLNMLQTLTTTQRGQLVTLAKAQVPAISKYGYSRFTLMTAFRRLQSGRVPSGSSGLDITAVRAFSASLYAQDGAMSIQRARVMGAIIHGLSASQRSSLNALVGTGMTSWPVVAEPAELRGLTGAQKVAVMTYAGDLFSWFAGSLQADVYFCPERQGTYFGSFYLKDAKAVGNPGYSIGTNITAEKGDAFLRILTPTQRARITALVTTQKHALTSIVSTRRAIAAKLRVAMTGSTIDAAGVQTLMRLYGAYDGTIVTQYATAFAAVGRTLTAQQKAKLMALRIELVGSLKPTGAYLYSDPIAMPAVANTDFLFRD